MIRTPVALARAGAGLATGDATTNAPDLLHIMNPIRLLLEEELVEMATERRRRKCLVAILALAILDGLIGRFRGRL